MGNLNSWIVLIDLIEYGWFEDTPISGNLHMITAQNDTPKVH